MLPAFWCSIFIFSPSRRYCSTSRCWKRHNIMSWLFSLHVWIKFKMGVWGRLRGPWVEFLGSPATLGSIIFNLNPLMSPTMTECVTISITGSSLISMDTEPWDAVLANPYPLSNSCPFWVLVVEELGDRRLYPQACCRICGAGCLYWMAPGGKLCPLLERHLWVWSLVIVPFPVHRVSRCRETKRESLLGEPQFVNLSRTQRHQTKPITLEIRSVGS